MRLFDTLQWRGFVHQVTHPELADALEKGPMTLYCGFDPTADSLHIGSLLPIMGLAHFQRAGHRVIALVGGGTGLIGDPSFKADERSLMTKEQVAAYVEGIQRQLAHFLHFDGPNPAIMLNNADWLAELPLLDFLRDIGKHFSVNVMLSKDAVRKRLEDREHGISYTEFSYSLLQAYDYLHLCRKFDCRLQVGGSDQWGNIVAGMDLSRRLLGKETFGMTFPLVTKADGSKFGKSEAGNVWLDSARTSPYRFYQFWINQADADVPRFLRYFTFLNQEEIEALEACIRSEPEKRAAQRRLAEEVTRLVHGEEALAGAVKASQAVFVGALMHGTATMEASLQGLDEATLNEVFSEAPGTELPRAVLAEGRVLLDVLVDAGVFSSKGEARRLVKSGGLYLNNERVDTEDTKLTEQALITEHIAVIRTGKKNYHLLRFV
ncbi:MAG TPA: tyrosine--tRNA ligase [Candidatus Hydrogenedentes bacterium]|nr:tyrosine--tRNA ligase [Candidatus Hydrogenedentota bacterium]